VNRSPGASFARRGGVERVLRSWLLLGALWATGHGLIGWLVRRHLDLTAAAAWTAALVTGFQALALEQLSAPLDLRGFLRRAGAGLRRPEALAIGAVGAGCVLVAAWRGPSSAALGLGGSVLILAASLLILTAAGRPGLETARWRLLALATLSTLAAVGRLSGRGGLLFVLAVAALWFVAVFRAQAALRESRPLPAAWLGAAAAAAALALVTSGLRWRLVRDAAADPGAVVAGALVLLAGLCLAWAGAALWREER
jgi:hypothetical protein